MSWIKSRWLVLTVVVIAWASRAPAAEKPLLIVANKHGNTLCYVDPETYEILDTIATGPNPHEIVITPDGRYAYLSNYAPPGNTISLIDLPGRKHVKQISTGQATRIHGAAIAPDGKFAYFTAGQTGLAVEVDTSTQSVTRTIPTEGKVSHMVLVSPDGKRLYTANIESEDVSVIDRATGRLITKIPCGKGVEGIAFTPDGKHLWAANQTGGSMTIIDVATDRPIETFPCGEMPVRIRFARGGRIALVPCWAEKGVVIVIDTATRKEIKRIPVGRFAIGIELGPDGKTAFVGCEHEDGIHVIDLEKMAVAAVIKTGNGPDPMMLWYPPQK
jgi:YVTN family beta-propeller protein